MDYSECVAWFEANRSAVFVALGTGDTDAAEILRLNQLIEDKGFDEFAAIRFITSVEQFKKKLEG
jgi:hypothetical protein